MAISSPCFEIWLLWHFEDRTAWIDAATLSKLLRKRGFSGKNMPQQFPYEKYGDAMARASRCAAVTTQHTPPNPHSSVPNLISVLHEAYGHSSGLAGRQPDT